MITLRPYQAEAIDAAETWIKSRKDGAVLELATGAGKSIIVAKIAEWFNNKTGLKVLCLAPSKELVEQNHAKFLAIGGFASIFCASITKSLSQNVVFGSPQTVLNSIDLFCERFALVIIDECHGITPTIKQIICKLKEKQKHLRIVGLSATPYRMNDGYIYQYDIKGNPVPQDQTVDPYFHQLIYSIKAPELIEMGYLTKPVAGEVSADAYDTSGLTLNRMGKFDAIEVEQAFEGRGRLTSAIVSEIVENSRHSMGVMIFAATIKHAQEIIESLPPNNSALVTGTLKKAEREKIIKAFINRQIKYIVNVAVLTTGFDATHVDHIALLRATESASLMQQIIGRGLRLHEGKRFCRVSDYAGNIERHCPDGDLFSPKIKAKRKGESEPMETHCPLCKAVNMFSARKNEEGYGVDAQGYFLDLAGQRIIDQETKQEYPAHYGRRCFGQIVTGKTSERCEYRWSSKKCFECEHDNDIAARYCEKCKAEIIDPNEKLKIDFKRMKADPYTLSTDAVKSWMVQKWQSQAGNITVKIDYTTEYATFPAWYFPTGETKHGYLWRDLCKATVGRMVESAEEFVDLVREFEADKPKTVTYKKNKATGFFEIFAHNRDEDVLPS
jgi:DNA repair protein RadD